MDETATDLIDRLIAQAEAESTQAGWGEIIDLAERMFRAAGAR